jgi:hypothetical protein
MSSLQDDYLTGAQMLQIMALPMAISVGKVVDDRMLGKHIIPQMSGINYHPYKQAISF